MRIPIASDLKTRTGAPSTKDARQVNSYMEVKGGQAAVRKRPAAQGGIAIGTGTAQGGIGLTINGTPYFIGFWGDKMQTYTGSGTSWSSGSTYTQGNHITDNFQDFWATPDSDIAPVNLNKNPLLNPINPTTGRPYWSTTPVPVSYAFTYSSASFPTCGGGFTSVDALGACALTKISGVFAPYSYDGFDANFMYFHGSGGGGSGPLAYAYTKTPI